MSEDNGLDNYPESNESLVDMLQDLLKIQGDILTKLEEDSEADSDLGAEFKGAKKKIIDEIHNLEQSILESSRKEEPDLVEHQSSLNMPLAVSFILIISILLAGLYSLNSLQKLDRYWEMQIKEKMEDASNLDKVIDLLEKQKENIYGPRQFD